MVFTRTNLINSNKCNLFRIIDDLKARLFKLQKEKSVMIKVQQIHKLFIVMNANFEDIIILHSLANTCYNKSVSLLREIHIYSKSELYIDANIKLFRITANQITKYINTHNKRILQYLPKINEDLFRYIMAFV